MRGLGKESNRVREVATDGLDHREACENDERNEQPTLAGIMRVPVWARTGSVARVMVNAVVLVGVRHDLGTLARGVYFKPCNHFRVKTP